MPDLPDEALSEKPRVVISREPTLILVRLLGEIDDPQSLDWRRRLTAEMQLRGAPRFVAFDMLGAHPKNSMSTRFEVAAYARDLMKQVEWAALLIPASVGGALIVRVVSSIVATSRISLVSTREAFDAILDTMRRGERPKG